MYPNKILGLFHLYGLMIAVGILACFGLLFWYGKKKNIEENFLDFLFYNGIIAIGLGFGSAALFQATYDWIETGKWNWESGITFIGGLIGGIVTFLVVYFIMRKRFKTRLLDVLSFIPCCILIAHAFGRLGCLFAGCCHGPETDAWYGIYMYAGSLGKYATVVPTQLFESLFLFALCGVCFFLVWKFNFKHNLSVYLIAYGIFRFCLEFVRADHRGEFVAGITPSQFWSIVMVVAGIALIFILPIFYKKREAELAMTAKEQPQAQAEGHTEDKAERMARIAEEAKAAHALDKEYNQDTEDVKDIGKNTEA
ncbi:MAG: prolipoprotein diacylglyceryl transferase [Clostridia bacterium]|nr:prolipoprotein diacylglyceryl transferase [Clostridia bacterium]